MLLTYTFLRNESLGHANDEEYAMHLRANTQYAQHATTD